MKAKHEHVLKRAFKKTRNTNGARWILFYVCVANCPDKYKQAYDLVSEPPVEEK